jgi:hypothetical protein
LHTPRRWLEARQLDHDPRAARARAAGADRSSVGDRDRAHDREPEPGSARGPIAGPGTIANSSVELAPNGWLLTYERAAYMAGPWPALRRPA